MPMYNKAQLAAKAKELSVVRDTLEKVCRLRDILQFFDESKFIRDRLALKGGTAINLLFFNLPRLSVDIDLDFCQNLSKSEMLTARKEISNLLIKYMTAEGYTLSPKSKMPHSLDSFMYDYINAAGMKDNIKIEINYSLRSHILPTVKMKLQSEIFNGNFEVNTISPIEIYAAKTVALITRAAARDLFDLNYMVRYGLFDESQMELYRKCVIFYLAVSTGLPPLSFDFSAIDSITPHKIVTDLRPVIRNREPFILENAKTTVNEFLQSNLRIEKNELAFLQKFNAGYYLPELLFDDTEILNRIADHPMAIWKTQKNRDRIND